METTINVVTGEITRTNESSIPDAIIAIIAKIMASGWERKAEEESAGSIA